MADIHNLQGIIAQSPVLNRLHEAPHYSAANGAQILNIIEQRKVNRRLKSVRQVQETSQTEKEETRKRRMKKAEEDRLIDITV